EAAREAIAQWQKTKSLRWLIAALCKADANTPSLVDLTEAAFAVPENSPAYLTARFHALRLGRNAHKNTTVSAEIDGVLLKETVKLPVSARNQFLGLRMTYATSFDEFLQFAPRVPAGVVYSFGMDDSEVSMTNGINADNKKPGARFDADAAVVLSEKFPLKMLAAAAKSEQLPYELQRMVTLAAWTRAVLLKNDVLAQQIAPRVVLLAPELKPAFDSYLSATTPEGRSFAATYAILKSPGLRPFVDAGVGRDAPVEQMDNLRDNWWCSLAPHSKEQTVPGTYSYYPW